MDAPPPGRRPRRRWRLFVALALLPILGAVLAWWIADARSKKALALAIERSEALGPLDFRELLRPMPPASENGYAEVARAITILKSRRESLSPEERDAVDGALGWSAEDLARAREVTAQLQDVRDLLRAGLDKPHARAPLVVPPNAPLLQMLLPYLSEYKTAARFLSASARAEAAAGNVDGALRDTERITALARGLEEDAGILVAALIAAAIRAMVCQTADGILAEGRRADSERLRRLAAGLRVDPALARRALVAERAFGHDSCLWIVRSGGAGLDELDTPTGAEAPPSRLAFVVRPVLRREHAFYLERMNDAIARADRIPFASAPRDPGLEPGILSKLLMPAIDKSLREFAKDRARSDATRSALAVLQVEDRRGRIPASLDEIPADLLPDRPLDPFSGKPFLYKPDPDGGAFLLYSVGEDRLDDGGAISPADPAKPAADIGIRWKTPAAPK